MNVNEAAQAVAHQECKSFLEDHLGILGVVISSLDGFDIASAVTNGLDPSRIAAMASSISAIGIVVSQEAALGSSKSVTVNTEDGFVYITAIQLDAQPCILNIIANSSAILAQVIYRCNEINKRLTAR